MQRSSDGAERLSASHNGDAAHHAVPIVIGAPQIVGSGRARRQKQILGIAGLHHDLGMLAIEHFGVVDFGAGEKDRCGKFVRLLALIYKMQAIVEAVLEAQVIGHEAIVEHGYIDFDRLRGGAAETYCNGDKQRASDGIFFHVTVPGA